MIGQILYIFDPLCGWCYGFSETMLKFYDQHKDNFEISTIPGGMVTGQRIGPIGDMEDYISKSYPQVEQLTGVKFGEGYTKGLLRSRNTIMNSEPPSRAVVAFRSFLPKRTVEYAHALQFQHYHEGRDYGDETLYTQLAESFNLDTEAFMKIYHDEATKKETLSEFEWVKNSGINGFPTVVYRSGENYYALSRGYTTLEQLKTNLDRAQQHITP